MKRSIQQQSDLFLRNETEEKKLPGVPESERVRVLQLLGDLLWTVVAPPSMAPSKAEESDE